MTPAGHDRRFEYTAAVRRELARHGLLPRPTTPPAFLRDAVRDLYKYEIRRLRDEHLAGRIAKRDLAAHVVALRRRYPILSLPLERWVMPDPADPGPPASGPPPDEPCTLNLEPCTRHPEP